MRKHKLCAAIAAVSSVMAVPIAAYAQDAGKKDTEQADLNLLLEEVQVTAMRQSLETSVSIKRDTMEIVDSITAEDIGKLPDPNVAETLTRIPGVQGYRYGGEGASPVGEGSGLTIRGLSGQTASRVDGRDYFTAGSREFNIESAIPGMIAGIDVYKNPSAEHVEGGIGGLVNIRTRKPLDFEERTATLGVSGRYNDLAEETSPDIFGLFADRWDTEVGEIGFLVAANYQESHNRSDSDTVFARGGQLRRATRADSAEYAAIDGVDLSYAGRSDVWYLDRVSCPDPDGAGPEEAPSYNTSPECLPLSDRQGLITALGQTKQVFQEDIHRVRRGAGMTLQWRPDDSLELFATGNYNYYLYDQDYRFMVFGSGLGGDSRYVQDLTTVDYALDEDFMNRNAGGGNNDLMAGQRMASGTFLGVRPEIWGGHEESPYETWTVAIGGTWQVTDKLDMTFDLSTIESSREKDNRVVGVVPRAGLSWDVSRDLLSYPHKLGLSGPDLADPSNFVFNYYRNGSNEKWDDDGWAAKVDFKYQLDMPLVTDIKFGARYATHDALYRNFNQGTHRLTTDGESLAADQSNAIPLSALPGYLETSPTNWLDGAAGYSGGFITYSPGKLGGNTLRDLFPMAGIAENSMLEENLGSRRYTEEETLAAYFVANFASGDYIEGNFGVRVVQTDLYARAMVSHPVSSEIVPNASSNSYTDVLPSFNLTGYLNEDKDTLMRLGVSKAMTRPSLGDLNPSISIDLGKGEGSGGNPELNPIRAISYDLSLEKYFSPTNYAALALFYKDIDGFFNKDNVCESLALAPTFSGSNGCPENQYRIERKVNAEKGSARGMELTLQTFFDYDFMPKALHNFGVSASYTRLKTENPVDVKRDGNIVNTPMPFQSDESWSLAGMFENEAMSARLVYTYRSDFVLFGVDSWPSGGRYVKGYGILDASLNFNLTDNLVLGFNASNIMDEAPSRYSGEPNGYESDFSVQHFVNGRVFGAGLTYNFF